MNNSKKKVSVIIPVYNGEKTLRQCLESVLDQAYKNYEVIIVNNNSNDRTKEIIKSFKQKNIKYIFEEYISRGAARNAGIKAATGKIITMTDADCIVPKNWLQKLTAPIIYGNEVAVIGSEKDLIKNYWTRNIQKANEEFLKRTTEGRYINHIDTKNFAIKSSTIKKIMFDANLENFEDLDLYLRLKKETKIRFIPLLKVGHNHKSSFIKTILSNFNKGFWTTKIYKKYKNSGFEKKHFMFESISLKNFFSFPIWLTLQFIKKPIGESSFLLISELSWRLGIIWALI
ncbi:MAG: glycosyltransferase family 2 protein [Candidatus Daviesbacteria bacterium]|nr:glycosyltransferase family 2 protein [Candidatus Daviesbacteria bacterium]